MQIGSLTLEGNVFLAPMAGVTDAPYRSVCRGLGAALCVGEMAASGTHLLSTDQTRRRLGCLAADGREDIPVVQIVGSDGAQMAAAARLAEQAGARIIDINFGCPARVVCGKACGSALMKTPSAARSIMAAVTAAVGVPVTVKMRLGWDAGHRTAVDLARAAQDLGVAAVTVHGRDRAQRFSGRVDRAGIAEVVRAVGIPVIANGDVAGPEDARSMLADTGAAGVMIGRGAYGNPWIFARTKALLARGSDPGAPTRGQAAPTVLGHFRRHMQYWTQQTAGACTPTAAVRSFRKHARWYMARFARAGDPADRQALDEIVRLEDPDAVEGLLDRFFNR